MRFGWAHEPIFLRRLHGVATLLWATVGLGLTLLFPGSILWVGLMSVWANVVGHWGAWQAARVEVQSE